MTAHSTLALSRLEEIVGAEHLVLDPARLVPYEADGERPAAAVLPGSAQEVAEVVRFAAAEKWAVIPVGGRSKLDMGTLPRRYDLALDLTRLNRVLAYDPGDLTLGAEAGIGFSRLNEVLTAERQFLPLAPPFAERATIGGILATNSGTPQRHAYGTARDYVLGMEFVTGEGSQVKSGGRVVKNVTGYDLHKLMIGALGTLGVITRVNFRTFPLPRAQAVFVASFSRAEEALAFCRAVERSSLQPRMVEVADPHAARAILAAAECTGQLPAERWSAVVVAAGHERVVKRHAADLARLAEEAHAGDSAAFPEDERDTLLVRIREFPKLAMELFPAATLLKISVLPTQMGTLLTRAREVADRNQIASGFLIRASGIVYAALLPATRDDSTLARLVQAANELIALSSGTNIDGRAVIEWCPVELKRQVDVWGSARGDLELMRRLKQVFDPQGILSPGRFVGGI